MDNEKSLSEYISESQKLEVDDFNKKIKIAIYQVLQ